MRNSTRNTLTRNTWKTSSDCLYRNTDATVAARIAANTATQTPENTVTLRSDGTIRLRSAPAPMSDWTYRVAALTAALLLLATAGGAL